MCGACGEFETIFVVAAIFAIIGGIIGGIRGMPLPGILLGFFLGPIGVIIIIVMVATSKKGKKKCPDCANWVNDDAKICSHCKHKFEVEEEPEDS